MTARTPHADFDSDHDEGAEEGLDLEAVRDWVGFVWRARLRRPKTAIGVFTAIAGLGLTVSLVMPQVYNSQVKLLVQPDLVGPALSNPGRAVPHDDDRNPTKNVADTIMRRDNLVALVKEANLVDRWDTSRPWSLRMKDKLFAAINGPQTEEQQLTGLAQTLEKRLQVSTNQSTMTISVDWQEPKMAYDLATLVQKNFIESRYDADVTAIEDAIKVLEDHMKSEGEQVDKDLAAYQTAVDALNPAAVAPPPTPPPATASPRPVPVAAARAPAVAAAADPDLAKALEEKRRQIRVVQDSHDHELETLKQQLVEAQLTLAPAHPTVIALQEKVDGLSQPPAELTVLRGEERALLAEIALASAPTAAGSTYDSSLSRVMGVSPAPGGGAGAPSAPNRNPMEDARSATAKEKLEASMHRYQEVLARLDSARLELDITRTAYRYRYSVVTPAEVPRGPLKKTSQIVGLAAVVLGALFALLAAAAADFRSGRIIETWQVRRLLGVEVVGELDPPS
jgi:uncharacterized protein involved in exopolysaccharide biosynthesis